MPILLNQDVPSEENTTPPTETSLFDLFGFGEVMEQLTELSIYSKAPQF